MADCEAGLTCPQGVCHDAREGAPCSATAECGARLMCLDNRCASPNASDAGSLWKGTQYAWPINFSLMRVF
jgi:hypothetical protein